MSYKLSQQVAMSRKSKNRQKNQPKSAKSLVHPIQISFLNAVKISVTRHWSMLNSDPGYISLIINILPNVVQQIKDLSV